MTTVSVKDAAKELHMDVLTLRYLMQTKELNIGFFIRRPGCRRGAYKIYRHLLDGVHILDECLCLFF